MTGSHDEQMHRRRNQELEATISEESRGSHQIIKNKYSIFTNKYETDQAVCLELVTLTLEILNNSA